MKNFNIENLISEVTARGYVIRESGGKLKCISIRGNVLDDETRAQLSERKTEIIDYLQGTALPLSFAEQRMWFLHQYSTAEKEQSAYNIVLALELRGQVNTAVLNESLQQLIARHENLRTIFINDGGKPRRKILPLCKLNLFAEPIKEESLAEILEHAVDRGFALDQWPLFSFRLFSLAPDRHVLSLVQHHIIGDGWSLGIIMRELFADYNSLSDGKNISLPAANLQYADFALWQRSFLCDKNYAKELDFWHEQLHSAPNLTLPTDFPRPSVKTSNGDCYCFTVQSDIYAQIQKMSAKQNATLFMFLLTTFYILLARYSGQRDIVVGSPIANRNFRNLENIIGFFVNTLALRCKIDDGTACADLLEAVKNICLSAYDHQNLPFEHIVDKLQIPRDPGRTPIFQVMLSLQNAHNATNLSLNNLQINSLPINRKVARFDLMFNFSNSSDQLHCEIEYNTDLHRSSTIVLMAQHFNNLLREILCDINRPINQFAMLGDDEMRQLIDYGKPEARALPTQTVAELFERQMELFPNEPALICSTQSLTYSELNTKANQLAHYLLRQIQSSGSDELLLIGLCLEQSMETIIAMLAIVKAGGAYVPFDPAYPKERLRFMLQDTKTKLIVTTSEICARFSFWQELSITPILVDDWNAFGSCSKLNPASKKTVNDLLYVMYTSGSTGMPKGVCIPQNAVSDLVIDANYVRIAPGDRIAQSASVAFDAATFEIWGALLNGACCVIIDRDILLSAEDFMHALQKNHITTIFITTALFNYLVERSPTIFSCCKNVLFGGEAVNVQRVQKLLSVKPNTLNLIHVYGPTEATTFATFCLLGDEYRDARVIPIGRAVSSKKLYVLDDNLHLVSLGVVGELYISGTGLARGYWLRPEITAEKFVDSPFDETKMYKTGDLVRWLPNGTLEYIGRIDNQVKIRGFRIELGEIENCLCQHPLIEHAVVQVSDDEQSGAKLLVAYIVLQTGATISDDSDMQSFLKSRLPDYMIPAKFHFVESLALNVNGKIDRSLLPKIELLSADVKQQQNYIAPRDATEKLVEQIWQNVLRKENIGINANFFHSGGDSIISMQVVSQLRAAGFASLAPKDLFMHPTIAQLADKLRQMQVNQENVSAAAQILCEITSENFQLTPIQQWFFTQNFANFNHYNQAVLFCLHESLNINALQLIFQRLTEHHDALRLRFKRDALGHWAQHYGDVKNVCAEISINVIAVPDASSSEQSTYITGKCSKLQQAFNVISGYVMGVALFTGHRDGRQRLFIIAHHLIIDGVSWRILMEDFTTLLQQLRNKQVLQLPAKTSSYQQWSLALNKYACSARCEQQLEYWRKIIGDGFGCRNVVDKCESSFSLTAESGSLRVALSADSTKLLLGQMHRVYNTQLDAILLTALLLTFYQCTGGKKMLIDLEGHGREAEAVGIDVSRAIGWFTCVYPVLLQLPEFESERVKFLGAAINLTRNALLAIPDKGIGYGALRYLSNKLSFNLQSDLRFNYLGQFNAPDVASAASESSGNEVAVNNHLTHALDINCLIASDVLEANFVYDKKYYSDSEAERFAHKFINCLDELICHCVERDGAYEKKNYDPILVFNRIGNKPNLFFVHPGGGGAEAYHQFANALGSDQPFCAVDWYNMHSAQPLITTMEELAAKYVSFIREVQPASPYRLGGWSFGGLLAYEMAQQLQRAGERVAVIYLLDSALFTDEEAREYLQYNWVENEIAHNSEHYSQVSQSYLERFKKVRDLEACMMVNYRPQKLLDAKLVLIKATKEIKLAGAEQDQVIKRGEDLLNTIFSKEANGWQNCASNFCIECVATDHYQLVYDKWAMVTAAIIDKFSAN